MRTQVLVKVIAVSFLMLPGESRASSQSLVLLELGRPNSTGRALTLEAVYAVARIRNSSSRAVALVRGPRASGLQFRLGQGSWMACPGPDSSSEATFESPLAAGASVSLLFDFSDCVFALPEDRRDREGIIELRARVTLSSGELIFSAPQSLQIVSPAGLDRDAHDYLKDTRRFDGKEFMRRFATSVYAGVWLVNHPEPSPDIAGRVAQAARSRELSDSARLRDLTERERLISAWLARNGSSSFLGQRALVEVAVLQASRGDSAGLHATTRRLEQEGKDPELQRSVADFVAQQKSSGQ